MSWGASGLNFFFWMGSLLIAIFIIVIVWIGRRMNKKDIQRFGYPPTLYRIFTNEIWKSHIDVNAMQTGGSIRTSKLIRQNLKKRRMLKDVLLFAALVLIIIASGRPQWGVRQEPVVQQGIDLVILLDTSESMKVEDVAPNRLAKAQSEISALLDSMQGNRVALIGFASTTRLHCPLTLDFRGLKSILMNSLSYGIGTDLEAAINEGLRVLRSSESKTKAFVVLSDGENHEGDLESAVQAVQQAGVRIFAIGIGTPEGGPIPEQAENGEESYKKRNGELVWSRLDETTLQTITEATSGAFFRASGTETEALTLSNMIQQLEKTEFSQKVTTHQEERFGIFLIVAVLLMAVEAALGDFRRASFQEDE
jgi:Ca-activated chloride channel homolog